MEQITIKNSDLTVSRFCIGGCPMGGYDWGETRETDFIDAIHTALDLGVNFFDTADTYGLGQSERTLAKGLNGLRHEVVIQTKFGVKAQKGKPTVIDNSPAYLRQALEASLRRLETDYIDIYVVHYWDQITPPAEVVEELEKQQQAGKIRYFGISNARPDALTLCKPYNGKFVTSQHEFSLCCRKWEAEIHQTEKILNVTPMTWGSLGQGMLTGKYDEHSTFGGNDRRRRKEYINFHGEKLKQNLKIVNTLREISKKHGQSCAATAIRFILDYLPDSIPIVGIKNSDQLKENVLSQDWHLDADEMARLNRISHSIEGDEIKEKPWQKEF